MATAKLRTRHTFRGRRFQIRFNDLTCSRSPLFHQPIKDSRVMDGYRQSPHTLVV